MNTWSTIVDAFLRWIEMVAGAIAAQLENISQRRVIILTENDAGEFDLKVDGQAPDTISTPQPIRMTDGQFETRESTALTTILPGSRVELILQPRHFVFRQVELPERANDFLDGIVRAQIDRLTPWSSAHAAFGWSDPVEVGGARLAITVAATAMTLVKPYLGAVSSFDVDSVAVMASDPESKGLIKVFEERCRQALDLRRIRKILISTLAGAGLATAVAIALFIIVGNYLDARHDQLSRQLQTAKVQLGIKRAAESNSAASARRVLEQHKHDVAATVLVLDALSQILPDHTYVTELRIEDQKLHMVGVTRDAPSLIGLIEQSGRFARATFFAPTTRVQSDSLERFHIEAVIKPAAGSPS